MNSGSSLDSIASIYFKDPMATSSNPTSTPDADKMAGEASEISTAEPSQQPQIGEEAGPSAAGPNDAAGKELPTIEKTEPTPITYHVKYKNTKGEVTEIRNPTEPFKLEPSTSDYPVFEILTTVTPIDPDEIKEGALDARKGTKTQEPGAKTINEADIHPENFEISATTLRIRSQKLLNALRAVVKYYPKQTLLGDSVTFSEPFALLMHHRAELEEYKSTNLEGHSEEYKQTSNEHIDILLSYLKNHFGESLREEEKRHQQTPPVCTFEYVWLFLKPGEPCFIQGDSSLYKYACNIKTVEGGMVHGRPQAYMINNWNVESDGFELGRVTKTCYVLPFGGEKALNTLTLFPVKFCQDAAGLKLEKKFIARGEKYYGLTKSYSYREYDGTTTHKPYRQVRNTAKYRWIKII